jgi:hypothetical protein
MFREGRRLQIILAVCAAVVIFDHVFVSEKITVNGGLGWDGSWWFSPSSMISKA